MSDSNIESNESGEKPSKPVGSPEKEDKTENDIKEGNLNEANEEVESSVDALGLLAESAGRDRNESEEEMDVDEDEAHTPESAPDQQEESYSGDAPEESDAIREEDFTNDEEQDIDIDEDFSLEYLNGDEKSNNDEIAVKNLEESSETQKDEVEDHVITNVVSLAAIENAEGSVEKDALLNIEHDTEKIDEKQITQSCETEETSIDEKEEDKSSHTLKRLNDTESTDNCTDSKKARLSEDFIKNRIKEEMQKIAEGGLRKEDLVKLQSDLQNAMKTLFGNTSENVNNQLKDVKESDEKKSSDSTEVNETVSKVMEECDSKPESNDELVIDLSEDEVEAKKPVETSIEEPLESENVPLENVDELATITKSATNEIIDLDESSSDSESKKDVESDKSIHETTVRIPSSIEVMSSGTNNNTTIVCAGNSGESVISGLPVSSPKTNNAMRINTTEITITAVTKTTEEESLQTQTEVLNLDSDDEDAKKQKQNISETNKDDGKVASFCINPNCDSESGCVLLMCPIFVLGIYKVKRIKRKTHPEICEKCLHSAIETTQKYMHKFKRQQPLIDIEMPESEEFVEILDSDSDNENDGNDFIPLPGYEALPDEELDFTTENLPDVMEDVCRKYNFNKQIESCDKVIKDNIDNLDCT